MPGIPLDFAPTYEQPAVLDRKRVKRALVVCALFPAGTGFDRTELEVCLYDKGEPLEHVGYTLWLSNVHPDIVSGRITFNEVWDYVLTGEGQERVIKAASLDSLLI